jgi:hypothetical protein
MAAPKKPWTDEGRERLRAAWFDPSLTMENLAKVVGRSGQVARAEAQRMGLPLRVTIRGANPGAVAITLHPPAPRPKPLPPGARTLPLLPSEEAALGTESLSS